MTTPSPLDALPPELLKRIAAIEFWPPQLTWPLIHVVRRVEFHPEPVPAPVALPQLQWGGNPQ